MGLLSKIHSYLHLQKNIVESVKVIVESEIKASDDRSYYKHIFNELTQKSLHDTAKGIANDKYGENMIVVSLTTHGKRIYDVHVAIESIFQGSIKPNKIVLWLSEEYKKTPLPITLQRQMARGLEVEYCKDIRSYTKLVPALRCYPEASIVTIDDDIIYPYDMLENLLNAHLESPNCICANWIHEIPADLAENYVSLLEWPIIRDVDTEGGRYFFEGFGGVLYPSHSFDKEVLNEGVYLDICKYADDVWFNAMSLKAGTKVRYAWPRLGLIPLAVNNDVQAFALKNVNSKGMVLNDIQIKTVFEKYGLFEKLRSSFIQNK